MINPKLSQKDDAITSSPPLTERCDTELGTFIQMGSVRRVSSVIECLRGPHGGHTGRRLVLDSVADSEARVPLIFV